MLVCVAVLVGACPGTVARASEREVRDELARADAPVTQLRSSGPPRRSFGVLFHRFQQAVAGVPVLGSEVVVTDVSGSGVDLLVDSSQPGLAAPAPPQVTRDDALAAARRATRAGRLRGTAVAALVLLPQPTGARLVWRVELPAAVPLASFEVLVDAATAAIVGVRDLLRRASGAAAVFDPNPIAAQGGGAGLSDGGDADSPALTALRSAVTLPRLEDSTTCLRGAWVWATKYASDTPVCASGRTFTGVTRSSDDFEPLMAYFHIDRAQGYLQSLGFTTILNRPIHARANVIVDDNSYFDRATGEIGFGIGGVDDAEDADVIVHEYGHAIQDAQVRGFGAEAQGAAMGEGFGDYLAATMSETVRPGSPFNPCVAEWDGLTIGGGGCLRRADQDLTAAQVGPGTACGRDPHCAGQAWSGALWDIRAQLSGPTADRLVIQSHFSLTSRAGFDDGARALLTADRALNGGVHGGFLRDVLGARGLLDLERFDDAPEGATPLSVPGRASGRLSGGQDADDLFRIRLPAGAGVVARLEQSDGELDLFALRPGFASRLTGGVAAQSVRPGATEELAFVASEGGDYHLDVATAFASGGTYVLEVDGDADRDARGDGTDNCAAAVNPLQEDSDGDRAGDACDRFPRDAANDADGDGVGAERDVCPSRPDPRQVDWDRDRQGDLCDRSSRVRIRTIRARRGRLTVDALVRPAHLRGRILRLVVERRRCRSTTTLGTSRRRCRYARTSARVTVRARDAGSFRLTARLSRRARYRLRVELAASGYRRARSPAALLRT